MAAGLSELSLTWAVTAAVLTPSAGMLDLSRVSSILLPGSPNPPTGPPHPVMAPSSAASKNLWI